MLKNLSQTIKNHLALILGSTFVLLDILATIDATKIVRIFGIAASAGIVLYPFTFMVKDLLQKRFGRKVARTVIWIAGLGMIFTFLQFLLIGKIPAAANWTNQHAYDVILTPVGRLAAASVVAMLVSELMDTYIFSKLYRDNRQIRTELVANLVGILIDSVIFTTVAFWGQVPQAIWWSIFWSNTGIKLIMTAFGSPTIFLVRRTKNLGDI